MKKAYLLTLVCGDRNSNYMSHITIAVEGGTETYVEDNKFYFKCDHYSVLPEGSAQNYEECFKCSDVSIVVPEGCVIGKPANPMKIHF